MKHLLGTCLVQCSTNKQYSFALSSIDVEYMAVDSRSGQLLRIKQQLLNFGMDVGCLPILCDNISVINIAKNPVQHNKTKHINIRNLFLQ